MNIDKDIKILKEFENYSPYEEIGETGKQAIKNVLSELETYKKANDNLLVKNAELKQDVQDFQQALNDENLRCSFYAIEKNDLKEKLEIQGNITETYKKIAEKLAVEFSCTENHICKYLGAIDKCKYEARKDNTKTCKECIIDWARKEVEKDES